MSKAKSNSARINEGFNRAAGFHQKGDLQQAERSYREVLAGKANHSGALHLLGIAPLAYFEVPCIDTAIASGRTVDFYYEHSSQFTTASCRRISLISQTHS